MEPVARTAANEGPTTMAGDQTLVNHYEKANEQESGQLQLFAEKSNSRRAGFQDEDSKALVSLIASKDGTTMAFASGTISPASSGSSAGNHVLDTARKLQLVSVDGEASPGSYFLTGSSLNRDLVLAKLNKDKILSLIKSWEENVKKKSHNSYNRKLAKIQAWEVAKKARVEASLRTLEERLENEKASCVEKAKNQIAKVQRIAEEQKALAEAHHGEDILKAEEIAAKCRASGTRPRRFPFCC